jgi:Ca-activated chloride channel family protein
LNRVATIIFFLFNKIIFSQDQGLEHYNNQKFDDAKKYYEALIVGNESIPEAHFGKGAASYKLGEFDSARDSFDKSLKSSDDLVKSKAYYNLGNTFYKNNKKDEAIKYYRKALELNPNDKEAKFNYELLKYHPDPPKEDNQDQQNQDQQNQEQENQEQENQEQENQEQEDQEQEDQEQEGQEQEDEEQEGQEQEDQEQEGQEEQMSEDEKSQDLKQAESILDALKQDDQIMQKKQIARSKSKKLAKDW